MVLNDNLFNLVYIGHLSDNFQEISRTIQQGVTWNIHIHIYVHMLMSKDEELYCGWYGMAVVNSMDFHWSSPLPDSSLIRNGKSRKQKKIWALCIGSNNFNWHVICISTSWATLDRWDKVSLMIVMMMVPCMSCLPVLKCECIRVHMTWFLITDNFRSVWHAFSGSILKNTSDYSNDSIE